MGYRKRGLPHLRRFLKRLPQMAIRGTTQDKAKSWEGILEWEKSFCGPRNYILMRRAAMKGTTREQVSGMYAAVRQAMGYAFSFSNFKMQVKGKNMRMTSDKTPALILVLNKNRKLETSGGFDWKNKDGISWRYGASAVPGVRKHIIHTFGPGLHGKKPHTKTVEIAIAPQDLEKISLEWKKYYEQKRRKGVPLLLGDSAASKEEIENFDAHIFLELMLIKTIIRKAIPHIRANLRPTRIKKK